MENLDIELIVNDFLCSTFINQPCPINVSLKQYLDNQEIAIAKEEDFKEKINT